MINITLEFFSRKTELLEKKYEIQLSEEIVFKLANTEDLNVIQCFGWDVTPEIVSYVENNYPEIAKDFQHYDAQFTGTQT